MKTIAIVGLMVLGVTACNSQNGTSGAPDSEPKGGEATAPKLSANAVADANAAVPDALKEKLKFVNGSYDSGNMKAPAVMPEGWEASTVIPGSYRPKGDANLGFKTNFSLGSNCDGTCAPKDWAATSEKVDFAQFKEAQFTLVKDEKQTGFRMLIATVKDGPTYLQMAFWKEGAPRYFTCKATLDGDIATALPAFEKACRAFTPVW